MQKTNPKKINQLNKLKKMMMTNIFSSIEEKVNEIAFFHFSIQF